MHFEGRLWATQRERNLCRRPRSTGQNLNFCVCDFCDFFINLWFISNDGCGPLSVNVKKKNVSRRPRGARQNLNFCICDCFPCVAIVPYFLLTLFFLVRCDFFVALRFFSLRFFCTSKEREKSFLHVELSTFAIQKSTYV
jgi:hypothetical protein